jgi:hypothetical protein
MITGLSSSALVVARGVIAIEVEPDLADRDGVGGEGAQLVE